MNKKQWMWLIAVCTVAAAAGICVYHAEPETPVVVMYQSTSVELRSETAAAVPPVTQAKQMTAAVNTAAETTGTALQTTAETRPPEHNLNLAAAEDLQRVSGIGEALAAAVIEKRSELGGFTYRAQLLEIPGIGEALLARIMVEFEIPDEQTPPEPEPVPDRTDEPELPDETPDAPAVKHYNANTVTREELLTLPDMTEARADAILDMRERLGMYHGIYEMVLAEGISGDYFEQVLHVYLYVEDDPYSNIP